MTDQFTAFLLAKIEAGNLHYGCPPLKFGDRCLEVSAQKVGGGILRQAQDAHPEPVEGCLAPNY